MRKRIKPLVVFVFFVSFITIILGAKHYSESKETKQQKAAIEQSPTITPKQADISDSNKEDKTYKPIIDLSGWQLPSDIDYDQLAKNISGVIIRVHSGAQAKKENAATHLNGIDKSYQRHIKEFQKRNIPVAVYAYVAGSSKKEMQKAAESFYKAASKYKPTYYWLDVEEKTMEDMNAGVEAFRAKLASLGAKNIGIYVGTYFLEEHSISTKKFTAIWIPTYGYNDGYYNAAPKTDLKYDLHQYTSQGSISGFAHDVDLNQLSPLKNQTKTFKKLFGNRKQ
ncbi:glycoside hydrolase family 25 protein [Streptococcus constellatus subsp. pharyngis]|uniref:Lyzozyme M1 n=1 Tax=Streptococcus constellatus subsp. pharyngis SK1060 = CCUG 46377 TaxID=1035184 RepID=U2YBP1_STRCV|nr:glycoside hydrolase family 25 protein [Streptococcus constellatus]AGU73131.1 glycosyl hydrolase family 25 [Streptococcus constellatus subsp. pharyngis C232]AGU74885.1 glycosyl hydrolase family 25 [Streptococcus constellatus subsp. pharyngis C818]AGU80276.1 glycosyl hydrolase family 25 [Streptococcus constellatus subsp. pharyngis C1050]QRP82525.1 glycoside hydrolase family 25 protein [Streptococcus constellatus]GAD44292.1 lyzozyme M1 [Streptococcus constellatus subsp. pharyngis SK1060 = CCUG